MIQNNIRETKEKQSNQGFKEEFEKLKNGKVEEATTRIVTFSYKSCCGCGCSYTAYRGEVPVWSTVKDGDTLEDIPDEMFNVERLD